MNADGVIDAASPVGKVWLVGAGPGDPGLLTMKAARAIAQADVLVYDYLAAAPIVDLASPACERIYVGKKAGAHTLSQDEITALIVRLGREGRKVVRLKGGDVFVFARGGEEADELRRAGVPFEICLGITSALAAPAYAGIPITHRDHNTSFTISTGHEDPLKGYSSLDFAKLANPKQTLVFLMAMGSLAGIVAQLRAHGMPGDLPVAIVREGTKPTQETLVATLDTIVAEVERARFAAPAIVVIGTVVNEREKIRWFDNQPFFGTRVLVTRAAEDAAEFAAALWEIGAEPMLAPTIALGPPLDPARARLAVERVRDYAWLVFTSRHGVDAFFAHLREARRDARALGDVRVAAIGPATASRLRRHGVEPDLVPSDAIGDALAELLSAAVEPGARVLLYRAEEGRDVVPQALAARGAVVDDVAGYRTVTRLDPGIVKAAAAANVWTFTSASTVRGFTRNVEDAARLQGERLVACIGPATADAARLAGLRVDLVAAEFTIDGLTAALRETAPA